MNIAFF